jgi:cytoskeletal protein CcmA (bactofilin family)
MVQGDVINEGGRLFVDKGAVVRGKVIGQTHTGAIPPPEKVATPATAPAPTAAATTTPKPPATPGP